MDAPRRADPVETSSSSGADGPPADERPVRPSGSPRPPGSPAVEAAKPGSAAAILAASKPDSPFKAIGLILLATALCAGADVTAKGLTAHASGLEVAWFRFVVFCLVILPPTFARNGRRALKVPRPSLQVARGVALAGSAVLFIVALEHLEVAETTAISFMAPIFITALSIPLLGEKVGIHRWGAALVGLAGVIIVVRPGAAAFSLAAFLPMAAAACFALGTIVTRIMRADLPEVTLAWSSLVGLAVTTVLVLPTLRLPGLEVAATALLMGSLAAVGHWAMILAFRRAPASMLAPFSYVQILYAGVLSYLVLGVAPAVWTFLGGALIAASGLYTAHRERRARATGRES